MTPVQQFEAEHDVRLIPKAESVTMRILNVFLYPFSGRSFMRDFWTTYRLPFQKRPTIAWPSKVAQPAEHGQVLRHELWHCEQFRPVYGPIWVLLLTALIPLPIFFSGRWFVERGAYLQDIRDGHCTVHRAVQVLWYHYRWAWPRPLMRRWFERRLREEP